MYVALLQIMCVLESNYLPPSWVFNSDVDCLPGFVAGHCSPSPLGFSMVLEATPTFPHIEHTHILPCTTGVYLYIPLLFPSVSFIISKVS